jgi:hypothetical protein
MQHNKEAMMKSYSTAENAENINVIHPVIKEWISETAAKNLAVFVKQGRIDVELPKYDPRDGRWDGTVHIHFKDKFTIAEVVNYIIGFARADEVRMEGENTLVLWWD